LGPVGSVLVVCGWSPSTKKRLGWGIHRMVRPPVVAQCDTKVLPRAIDGKPPMR
jgi:hypothetical protein